MAIDPNQIKVLQDELVQADKLYRLGKDTGMSDEEYDKKLKYLETLIKQETPIEEKKETDTVLHMSKMYSINNVYGRNELLKWLDTFNKPLDLYYDVKIDGLACALRYENGNLVGASTRGDGEYGTDILNKVVYIPNIPKSIPNTNILEIYGEVYITEDNLFKINSLRTVKYNTCRACAIGLLSNKDIREELKYLSFSAYGSTLRDKYSTVKDMSITFKEYGFNVPIFNVSIYTDNRSLKPLWDFYDKRNNQNNKVPADGIVIKINNIQYQNELGYTQKAPRYYKAWKFTANEHTTKVLDFEYAVSRYGRIVPVVILDPIEIDGTTISRVTAISESWIQEKNIAKDVEVNIIKAGGVIPKIQSVALVPFNNDRYKPIERCPACKGLVHRVGRDTVCANKNCIGKTIAMFNYMVSKHGLDIKGLGPVTIEKLVIEGSLNKHTDLFKLEDIHIDISKISFLRYLESISSGITNNSVSILRKTCPQLPVLEYANHLNSKTIKELELTNAVDKAIIIQISNDLKELHSTL